MESVPGDFSFFNLPVAPSTSLCVSQFQPQASPRANPRAYPGHLKKLFKCPVLRAIFVGKCPPPRSFCGGQMPGPPVRAINIQSYWLPYFNKHNF